MAVKKCFILDRQVGSVDIYAGIILIFIFHLQLTSPETSNIKVSNQRK